MAVLILIFTGNRGIAAVEVAAVPLTAQSGLLKSSDPKLEANKRLAYDFFRVVLMGRRLEETPQFLSEGYIQHNPNVKTGRSGFLEYFSKRGGKQPVPAGLPGLVAIQAEGDFVTLSFVDDRVDKKGRKYTTTWFDMFRIQDGKIAEHWDCDRKAN